MQFLVRWALGLSMSFLSASLSAAGFIMQRKAHLRKIEDRPFRRLLLCGVAIYIAAAAPDVAAYILLPEVVCSTMACLRLVVLTASAHAFLSERVARREVWGCLVCTTGTALCVLFGPRPRKPGEQRPPSPKPYIVTGLCVLAALLLLDRAGDLCWKCKGPRAQKVHYMALPVATGLAYGLEKIFNTEIGLVSPPQHMPLGLLEEPSWTLLVVATGLLGLTDLYLNMRGAKLMLVQVFVPTSFALSTTLQYFQSVVIFGEFRAMGAGQIILSVFGAVASLIGALCIQPREVTQSAPVAANELQLMC